MLTLLSHNNNICVYKLTKLGSSLQVNFQKILLDFVFAVNYLGLVLFSNDKAYIFLKQKILKVSKNLYLDKIYYMLTHNKIHKCLQPV